MVEVVECKERAEAVENAYGYYKYFFNEVANVKIRNEFNGDLCILEYTYVTEPDEQTVNVMIFDRKKEITVQKTYEDGEEEITIYIVENLKGEVHFPYQPID